MTNHLLSRLFIVVLFINILPQVSTLGAIPIGQDNDTITSNSENRELEEIVVKGTNPLMRSECATIDAVTIPVDVLQKVPMLMSEPDIVKYLQLQPGVQQGIAGTSSLLVRGGGADQNLYILDGTQVYSVNHAFGFLSLFQSEMLKQVNFYKEGFPARYGGRLSSVVDIRTKEGNLRHYHGNICVGLLTSHLLLEGPIVKDKVSFFATARRSYLDWLIKPFMERGESAGYSLFDVHGKIRVRFNDRLNLTLMHYQGNDRLGYKDDYEDYTSGGTVYGGTSSAQMRWGNRIENLTLTSVLSPKLQNNTILSYSGYKMTARTQMEDRQGASVAKSKNTSTSHIEDWSATSNFHHDISPTMRWRYGVRYSLQLFCPNGQESVYQQPGYPDETRESSPGKTNIKEWVVYYESENHLTACLLTNIGLHYSHYSVEGKDYRAFLPRFSMKYNFYGQWHLRASYAMMQQAQYLLASSELTMPGDFWACSTRRIRPMRGSQYSIGAGYDVENRLEISASAYYKYMHNLLEFKEGRNCLSGTADWQDDIEMGKGWSYGVELSANYQFQQSTLAINYTWSKSERRFEGINGGKTFPFRFDRRHQLGVSWDLAIKKNLDLHADWQFASGSYISAPVGYQMVLYPTVDNGSEGHWTPENLNPEHQSLRLRYSGRNNYQLPPSHSLNLSMNLHRSHKFGEGIWNISVMNAYNAKNPDIVLVDTKEMADGSLRPRLKQFTLMPCLPSFSYTYKF